MRKVNQLNAALNQKRGYCLEKERNVPGVLRVFLFRSQLDVVVEVVLPESKQWTTISGVLRVVQTATPDVSSQSDRVNTVHFITYMLWC